MKEAKAVVIFDLKLNFINRFISINKASNFFKTTSSSIKGVLDGNSKIYLKKFFIFSEEDVLNKKHFSHFKKLKEEEKNKKDTAEFIKSMPSKHELHKISIFSFNEITFSIQEFDSLTIASKILKINKGAISDSCNYFFKRKVNGLYFFKKNDENLKKITQLIAIKKELIVIFPELNIKQVQKMISNNDF